MESSILGKNYEEYFQDLVEVVKNRGFDCLLWVDDICIHKTKHDGICVYKKSGMSYIR